MKNYKNINSCRDQSQYRKILTAMKLAVIFTFFGVFNASASAYSQSEKVSLDMKNTSVTEVLHKIESLTNYHFIYSLDLIRNKKTISIHTEKASVKEVLHKILTENGVGYKLLPNSLIVVTPQKKLDPLLVSTTFQQTLEVKGIVSDEKNMPLSGVTVMVKGTSIGTVTDKDGSFSLDVPHPEDTLIITFVGYETQEVPVKGQKNVNIQLQPSTTTLNDFVVIGYQTISKKDLTGAVSVVNTENTNKISANSIGAQLQGQVPGVTVRQSGNPGAASTLEIRGVGSFGNSTPLYVIDGMLADANNITIDPGNVASIQVLKDASAAAIYGSRAGNGVVIITTKTGKKGPAKINFSAKYGIQQIAHRWDVMNAPNYLKTVQKQYQNSGINPPSGITDQTNDPTVNTDWQDEVFRTGNTQNYNLSISGGAEHSSYFLSGSYYKNEGTLIANDLQRPSLRINTEAKKGIFTIGEHLMISNSTTHHPSGFNAFIETPMMPPIISVKGDQYKGIIGNPDGWGMGTTDLPTYANNYVANSALSKNKDNYTKLVGNAYIKLKIADWLTYKFNMGAEVSFDYHKTVRDTGIWRYTNQPSVTRIGENRSLFTNFLMEHTLNFNKTFNKHAINGVLGFSRTQQKRKETSASRTHLQRLEDGTLFTTISSAFGDPSAGGGTPVFWRSHGFLGRVNYAYDSKYLVTLSGRIDQDSRFGKGYRTGYFPSGAVAWRISKEDFFDVDWINDLKVRASYGKLGFSSVLGSWDYLGTLNNNPRAIYGVNQDIHVGQYQAAISNPTLHWETRIQKDIGLEAELLENKLSFTFDWYHSLSKDVLLNLPLPSYLGSVGSSVANTGSIKNTGFELSARYKQHTNPFSWSVAANVTTIKNKILSVGNQGVDASGNKVNYLQPTNFIRAQVGHSIGEWYVIRTDGIFQSQDEVNNYTDKEGDLIQPKAEPGDIKYVDANGDGKINNDDRQFSGSPWPKLQAGAQFNASYKNFSMNIQLVGIFGYKLYNGIRQVLDSYEFNNFRTGIDPWSSSNKSGTDPRLIVDNADHPTASINSMPQTSRWIEDGSYIRLRNLQIGYSVPESMLKGIGLSELQLYVSGQNLFTLTKYTGMDPDVQGNGILERGFDSGNWPNSRIFSVGLNLGF